MYDNFGEWDPKKMPMHLFFGASHLDYTSAVRADISKQDYSVCPRHWYLDATFRCPQCRNCFEFSVDEQRFWYEELGFWIDSTAKHCRQCRRDLRHLKALRQEYDRDIKQALLSDTDLDRKRRMLELIGELAEGGMQLPERVIENQTTLEKQLERDAL